MLHVSLLMLKLYLINNARASLKPYGYTLISKGTLDQLKNDTLREAEVHRTLRRHQGSAIPICLGTIDPQHTFFVHPKDTLRYAPIIMGSRPTAIDLTTPSEIQASCNQAKRAIKREIGGYDCWQMGNRLWDPHMGCFQLVNFDSLPGALPETDYYPVAYQGRAMYL